MKKKRRCTTFCFVFGTVTRNLELSFCFQHNLVLLNQFVSYTASLKTTKEQLDFCLSSSYVTALSLEIEWSRALYLWLSDLGQMVISPVWELSLCFIYLASTVAVSMVIT